MNRTFLVARNKLSFLIISVLLIIYLVNCFTPIRLTFDTVRYLKIKEWIEAGRPPGAEAAGDFLPHGYVWFLYLLGKLGICYSPVICFLQFCYFISGCWLLRKTGDYKQPFPLLLLLCLLNWIILKFVITPLSE